MLLQLPRHAVTILQTIAAAGGQGYVVGGALRDLLRGKTPQDWDFAATLPAATLLGIFSGAKLIGGICGTVQVPFGTTTCEITPCRAERGYTDHRHPDEVVLVSDILQDLARRDFTINAMAFNGEALFDPFGGQQDLEAGILRCVGNPAMRFQEDPLRILRLFRFMATLGFAPAAETFAAAVNAMQSLATLSPERVRAEVEQILLSPMPQVLGTLVTNGGLRGYGFKFAPQLKTFKEVPPTLLCRWWAFITQCGAKVEQVGSRFGFSARFLKDLNECTRLYHLGPAASKVELKMKLRNTLLDYAELSATFAAVNPVFIGEPVLYAAVRAKREPYRLAQLAIDGDMLRHEGIRGEKCGRILEELLKTVIKDPALNQGPVLMGLAEGLKQLL
ncbi:CCA tRNA nucleotidyltransferase [Ruminococcaceae bacterium OttesenSCG-928-A16]|nr:CCA tRNA nucleotidyltransferase [Ruminococcaceae bacterium OttesenSCG-928-A16]